VIVDHAVHVGGDPALVAQVELLERAVIPGADAGDERVVVIAIGSRARDRKGCGG
jgi:hypothetical protein